MSPIKVVSWFIASLHGLLGQVCATEDYLSQIFSPRGILSAPSRCRVPNHPVAQEYSRISAAHLNQENHILKRRKPVARRNGGLHRYLTLARTVTVQMSWIVSRSRAQERTLTKSNHRIARITDCILIIRMCLQVGQMR